MNDSDGYAEGIGDYSPTNEQIQKQIELAGEELRQNDAT